jgi:pimeloyl-ACP methyl ester carboxylesterase
MLTTRTVFSVVFSTLGLARRAVTREIWCRERLKRAWLILVTALLVCLKMTSASVAEQISFEAAASAAGVAVKTGTVLVNGVSIYYRDIGGGSETVVLLHGFPETGDAFAPVIGELTRRFRLIIPDMRGFGRSQRTPDGYDTKTVSADIEKLLDYLKINQAHLVGHDLGARVAFAFALQFPQRLRSLTVGEAFIEGLAGTERMKQVGPTNPRTRHFAQYARVDEAVAQYSGKEEELILSFMNSRTKARQFTAADVALYSAALKREDGLRAGFKYYEAFAADEAFVVQSDKSGLRDLPALAMGCEGPGGDILFRQFTGAGMQRVVRKILNGCAHWIFEENPEETLSALLEFLSGVSAGSGASFPR